MQPNPKIKPPAHVTAGNESPVIHVNAVKFSVRVCFQGDLNCIAGATSRNGAFIWDVRKGKIITRFNEVTVTELG